jgi:serine phosphatase RsbU (regulator of sigma subunit)
MSAIRDRFWPASSKAQAREPVVTVPAAASPAAPFEVADLEISPADPFLVYVLSVHGVIEVDRLSMNSPTLARLKEEGYKISVPLISQGELIGLLNLGPRRSEQDYSSEDLRLLSNLATQAAPALRLAQIARQQQIEAAERERIEQELRVARVIQQTLLPKEVPQVDHWQMAAYWKPARAVSGDFYDFISYADGRIGIIIADVTDKGVPAALVMAATRSILRSAAEQFLSPGLVLERVNTLLVPDIPPNMFVTCLYLLLDPATGLIRFANAGHPLAFHRTDKGIEELRARGMPLGLMEGMPYEEKEAILAPGEGLLLYSDGLVEAHNESEEMFSLTRVRTKIASPVCSTELIQCLMLELEDFTGPDWEQEDDVTLVTVERLPL